MSNPVRRSHSAFCWPNEETQVMLEVGHTEAPKEEFIGAFVKVTILRSPAPSPTIEFKLGRLPEDLVEARTEALAARPADRMLASVGIDPKNILLGETTEKPRKMESGGQAAKIVADVFLTSARICLTVGDWTDVIEVAIQNHGDQDAGQYWSVRPQGAGWEFMLH